MCPFDSDSATTYRIPETLSIGVSTGGYQEQRIDGVGLPLRNEGVCKVTTLNQGVCVDLRVSNPLYLFVYL